MTRGPSLWQVTRHPFTAMVYGLLIIAGLSLLAVFWAVVLAAAAVAGLGYGAFRLWTRNRYR